MTILRGGIGERLKTLKTLIIWRGDSMESQ